MVIDAVDDIPIDEGFAVLVFDDELEYETMGDEAVDDTGGEDVVAEGSGLLFDDICFVVDKLVSLVAVSKDVGDEIVGFGEAVFDAGLDTDDVDDFVVNDCEDDDDVAVGCGMDELDCGAICVVCVEVADVGLQEFEYTVIFLPPDEVFNIRHESPFDTCK